MPPQRSVAVAFRALAVWRGDDPALDLFVLDPFLPALLGLGRVLGREVFGAIAQAGLEAIEERLMAGPVGARPLDLWFTTASATAFRVALSRIAWTNVSLIA